MNRVLFIARFLAADANFFPNQSWPDLEFRGSKIRIIRGDIGNCDHRPRCASCSTARSANKLVYAQSATKSFAIITTSSPTIGIRKEWAEGGGTIIRTTSKPHIGGVTKIVAEHGHELRNRPRSLGQWPRAFSKIFSIGSESTSPDWL